MIKNYKFLTKATMLLLSFLAVPLGMLGQTKITDYNNIVSGTQYYIGATTGGNDFYLSVNGSATTNSIAGTAVASMDNATPFTFEGSGDSWTIQFESGNYLSLKDGKDNGKVQVVESAVTFTASNQTSKLRLSKGNYSIQKNNSGTQFGSYGNTQTDIWLMEVPVGLVATTTTIDASGITNTDVYTGTAAGSLTATVTETESGNAVSGATVTWTSSKENVATIDENGVVTLVAAGTTTITASYEGVSGEFGASSATYELTVTSSAPYEQPTEFEIGLNNALFGTNYNGSASGINDENPIVGTQDNVTVTYAGGGNHYVNDAQIRFYPSNKLTFEAPEGYEIKEIVFTSAGTWTATITADGGTYDSSSKTWTGSATSVLFTGSGSGRCDMSKASITLGLPSTDPTIEANNVSIAYDATSGEIAYTINNPVPGTLLQATADADWVSDITVGDEAITFTTTANELKTERVATFTLTYEGAEDKTVTVTQAGNPNIIDKIENISESGVPYNVQGTVVATSARAFVIGDGTGYIYYYNGNTAPSVSVGDMVKISGTTGNYGNVIQFTNAATITEATESEYTPLTPAAMTEVPDYTSGLYKSDYYQFEGMLTKEGNYYVVAVGSGQIRISYPSASQTTELDALLNNTVKVKGFFAGNSTYNNNTIFTAIMESIEEVVSEDPAVTLANYNISVAAEGGDAILTVQYQNIDDIVPDIQFYEEDGTTETTAAYYEEWLVAELDNDNNVNYVVMDNTGEERKAYFKVFALVGEDYVYSDMITITQEAKEAANVTWNLSIDETATASTTEMSWTSDFATMKVEKAGAGTNTNNYYPGTTGQTYTSTRFYKNSELTIAPKAGYKITKVEFTATNENYASALNNSTWTNATAAVDGTNVAVTPTNGNLAMVATIGGTCGFTGVKVYYEESDVMVIEIKNGFTATTFSCNKALDFTNADVTAQIITDEVGTTQTVTVVPAETGLYITGEPGIHEIPVADASAETDNVDSNKLKAVMEASQFATQNSVTFYAFGKQKGKEAFYKIPTSGYNVPAGKAVLRITKANAPEMIVVNGGTTGVESIENSQLTIDNYYTVDGRLVNGKPTQKGIYIVGGRKVVVK